MTHTDRGNVLQLVREHPSPVRSGSRAPALAGLAALALAAMTGIFFLWGGFANAGGGRPEPITAWLLLGTVALAAGASWLSLPRRRSMLSRPRGVLLAVAVGVPVAVGLWLMLWGTAYDDPFYRAGWRCFALTALTAPWPFAVLVYASRRVDPVQPGLTGAALGAAAGAWAAVMVELWCPLADASHALKGHVLPLLPVVLFSALLGRRAFRLRAMR